MSNSFTLKHDLIPLNRPFISLQVKVISFAMKDKFWSRYTETEFWSIGAFRSQYKFVLSIEKIAKGITLYKVWTFIFQKR